jgi:hypothetical protein
VGTRIKLVRGNLPSDFIVTLPMRPAPAPLTRFRPAHLLRPCVLASAAGLAIGVALLRLEPPDYDFATNDPLARAAALELYRISPAEPSAPVTRWATAPARHTPASADIDPLLVDYLGYDGENGVELYSE